MSPLDWTIIVIYLITVVGLGLAVGLIRRKHRCRGEGGHYFLARNTLAWSVIGLAKCGVDVLCLGGTKNGMLAGEAILFFDRSLSPEFAYRCKQAGQLASKSRFLSAQWVGMLEERAWPKHAGGANKMAKKLEAGLRSMSGVRVICTVEENAVFVEAPSEVLSGMRRRGWEVYTFIGTGGARFMCSWDTTESDIARLLDDLCDIAAKEVTG